MSKHGLTPCGFESFAAQEPQEECAELRNFLGEPERLLSRAPQRQRPPGIIEVGGQELPHR